jgi:hypothetical protein
MHGLTSPLRLWAVHMIFSASLQNVRALQMQILSIRQHGVDPSSTPVPQRVAMFFRFRQCMGLYVFTDLLITFLTVMLMKHGLWLELTLHEAVDWFLFVGASVPCLAVDLSMI